MNDTIFDYGVTDKEKMIMHVRDWNKVEYVNNTGIRERLRHLYLMFIIRCENDKAKTILGMLKANQPVV